MTTPESKTVASSHITLHQLMLPEHANALGNVHGGLIMKMVDEAGGIAAMRHAQRPCATVAMDSMTFHSPVHVGELLSCEADVSYVGRTSVEVRIRVQAENPITGETTHTNSANVVYVALDDDGHPCPVPRLVPETEEQHRAFAEAEARHQARRQERGR